MSTPTWRAELGPPRRHRTPTAWRPLTRQIPIVFEPRFPFEDVYRPALIRGGLTRQRCEDIYGIYVYVEEWWIHFDRGVPLLEHSMPSRLDCQPSEPNDRCGGCGSCISMQFGSGFLDVSRGRNGRFRVSESFEEAYLVTVQRPVTHTTTIHQRFASLETT